MYLAKCLIFIERVIVNLVNIILIKRDGDY